MANKETPIRRVETPNHNDKLCVGCENNGYGDDFVDRCMHPCHLLLDEWGNTYYLEIANTHCTTCDNWEPRGRAQTSNLAKAYALLCDGDIEEAKQLIETAFMGVPPEEIGRGFRKVG